MFSNLSENFSIRNKYLNLGDYGRQGRKGSWISFILSLSIIIMFIWWLPISDSVSYNWSKIFQVSNVAISLAIFILMAFSLNLHTGYTGMKDRAVMGMDGNGGQSIMIDFDRGRIIVINAIHNNYNWKKIAHSVIKKGK